MASRSRGTPRIANRLLRRVRDYAQVRADGVCTLEVARRALDLYEVDRSGSGPPRPRGPRGAVHAASAAARSGSAPSPWPSARSGRPSRRSPSRSWCGSACWPAPPADGSPPRAAWEHLGLAPPASRRGDPVRRRAGGWRSGRTPGSGSRRLDSAVGRDCLSLCPVRWSSRIAVVPRRQPSSRRGVSVRGRSGAARAVRPDRGRLLAAADPAATQTAAGHDGDPAVGRRRRRGAARRRHRRPGGRGGPRTTCSSRSRRASS